jgi:transposase
MFLKIYEELGELISTGDESEYADVMLMLLDYGSRHFICIERVIRDKMAINEKRKWGFNDMGVAHHVE